MGLARGGNTLQVNPDLFDFLDDNTRRLLAIPETTLVTPVVMLKFSFENMVHPDSFLYINNH